MNKASTIIFVHGLYMKGFVMERLAAYFRSKRYQTKLFSYDTLEDNYEQNCADLAQLILNSEGPCAIICHSLGGLITQGALKSIPEHRVSHVISLGTPWQGARITEKLKRLHLELLAGKKLSILLPRKMSNVWHYPIPLGSIAGKSAFGIGTFLGSKAVYTDGTVEISETVIEGMTDHIVLPVSHTGMIFSRRVAAQCFHFILYNQFKKP